MNLFNELTLKKENITVLQAEQNSAFLCNLKEYIGDSVCVTAPDILGDKFFLVHKPEEISAYKEKGFVIGIVNVDVFEKRICDVIKNYEDLCAITNVYSDELVYPFLIAKTIIEREKYDLLYIDGVNSESKRFLARELAKNIKNGMAIRIINTDSGDVEILCR